MQTALQLLGVALLILAFWFGIRRVELASVWKATLSILDLALLVISVVSFGWLGLVVAGAATVLGGLAVSVRWAVQKDHLLTGAAVRAGVEKHEIEEVFDRLANEQAFAATGPIELATLVRLLTDCGRSPSEILAMAPPVAMLSAVHDYKIEGLVSEFDRLLRLYGEPATQAMDVADVLTAATQASATSFAETLAASIAVAEPSGSSKEETAQSLESASALDAAEFQRQVRIQAELAVRTDENANPVRLIGGPMDGFLVYRDAPALSGDWYRTWPESIASAYLPGRYVIAGEMEQDTPVARWQEFGKT
jgi:hypothetical protein